MPQKIGGFGEICGNLADRSAGVAANWGFGDVNYTSIRNSTIGTAYCITVQYWFNNNNNNNNPDRVADPLDTWGDYVFAVVTYAQDSQLGRASTYNYSNTPAWLSDPIKRSLRKGNYYTGASCTGTD